MLPINNIIDVHEFTRGFRNVHEKNGIWVSGGFDREIVPHTEPVPKNIEDAVNKDYFRINDNYPLKM